MAEPPPGRVVLLNGAPRSGKTSIAEAMQQADDDPWLNLGVDAVRRMTAPAFQPGIGLRPGGERPDLEPFVAASYRALFDSVAAHARHGLDVVVDVGLHDDYSTPLDVRGDTARRLAGLPVWVVGVRCPLDVIMERRRASAADYLSAPAGQPVPEPVRRWQEAVHANLAYDLEVDTSVSGPPECADAVLARIRSGQPRGAMATWTSDSRPAPREN